MRWSLKAQENHTEREGGRKGGRETHKGVTVFSVVGCKYDGLDRGTQKYQVLFSINLLLSSNFKCKIIC
jgi:hypothetical protein